MRRLFLFALILWISLPQLHEGSPVYASSDSYEPGDMEMLDDNHILVHGNCFEIQWVFDRYTVELGETYPILTHTEDDLTYSFTVLSAEDRMIGGLEQYALEKLREFDKSVDKEEILVAEPSDWPEFKGWISMNFYAIFKDEGGQIKMAAIPVLTDTRHTVIFLIEAEGNEDRIPDAMLTEDIEIRSTMGEALPLQTDTDEAKELGNYAFQKGQRCIADSNEYPEDYTIGLAWYQIAAKLNQAEAQFELGNIEYQNGLKNPEHYEEALSWFRKSANNGNTEAQYYLGLMFLEGKGGDVDYSKAAKWFKKAAKKGNKNAQYWMGYICENGLGSDVNAEEALKWYQKAADQGDQDAAAAMERLSTSTAMAAQDPEDSDLKPVLINDEFDHVPGNKNVKRSEIQRIVILDTLQNVPEDAWDMSEDHNGSVMGWVSNGVLKIAGEGGVYAPENASRLFAFYTNAQSMHFADHFHTEDTNDMDYMFFKCQSMLNLDLTGFDTSNVTTMQCMFAECIALKNLDLSGWKTKKLENLFQMFAACISLESLDLSSFDTRNLHNGSRMFRECTNLQTIYVGDDFVFWGSTDNSIYSSLNNKEEFFLHCPARVMTPDGKAYSQYEWLQSAAALNGLRRGSAGLAAAALQRFLIEMGFLKDTADGQFGVNTEKALMSFQEAAGLTKTGELDYDTLKALHKMLSNVRLKLYYAQKAALMTKLEMEDSGA